jgi:hypothetical protein
MPRSETQSPSDSWRRKTDFMREVGATEAEWSHDGYLVSIKLAPITPRPPQQQAEAPAGPAAKLAKAFQERLKRDNEVRFAATHFRPRIETPTTAPTDDVPRAVRAREASRGRPSPKQPNR